TIERARFDDLHARQQRGHVWYDVRARRLPDRHHPDPCLVRHSSWGAPIWPPIPPSARTRPGEAVARLGLAVARLGLALAPLGLAVARLGLAVARLGLDTDFVTTSAPARRRPPSRHGRGRRPASARGRARPP